MRIRTFVLSTVLVTAVFGFASSASAVTIEELVAQIAQLQAQLQALLAQQNQNTSIWCHTFDKNMGYGATGPDFNALIIVLDRESIIEFDDNNRPPAYNEIIGAAVVKLQAKYGIMQTGYVGPLTRAKLNALYGCTTTQPSIKIISPIAGTVLTSKTLNTSGTCSNYSGSVDVYYYSDKREDKQINCTNGIWSTTIYINSNAGAGSFDLYAQAMGDASAMDKINLKFNWSSEPSIIIISPAGGEQMLKDQTFQIKWSTQNMPADATYTIRLTNGNSPVTGGPNITIVSGFSDSSPNGTHTYSWVVQGNSGNGWGLGKENIWQKLANFILPKAYAAAGTDKYYIQICEFNPSGSDSAACVNSNIFTINLSNFVLISPNGGETFTAGQTMNITWNSGGLLPSDVIKVWLVDYTNGNIPYSYTLATNLAGDVKQYNYTIPNPFPSGTKFKVDVEVLRNGVMVARGLSANYFTIAVASTNLPPVISGVSGPTTLNVNQTGTWTITASDPENGTLNYSAIWGDEPAYPTMSASAAGSNNFVQTATFTHSYSGPGTYTPIFYVRDTAGNIAKTSLSVNVGATAQPTITVTSPNGGETWRIGETHYIVFTSSGINKVNIIAKNITDGSSYSVAEDVVVVSGSHSHTWVVGYNVAGFTMTTGQYKIEVFDDANSGAIDTSDNYFTIATAAQPAVTVTSPNGGETLTQGSTQTITWTSTGFDSTATAKIQLYRVANGTTAVSTTMAFNAPNTGSYTWTVPVISAGDFKIRVLLTGAIEGVATSQLDFSDNTFKIAAAGAPSVTVTSPNGGETWTVGQTKDITWTSTGFDSTATAKIQLYRTTNNIPVSYVSATAALSAPNTGSFTWTAPNITGAFKMRVLLTGVVGGNATSQWDWSDNSFSISSVVTPSSTSAVLTPSALAGISQALGKILEQITQFMGR